ncbi:MAG: 50S ribosomal protein L24 [Deltaproteobacteria bacterium]|nr:50S ribosomal protein L24 [Deltaproteobacteria bacterium]
MQATTVLRTGDVVQVLTGRDRKKTGKILRVDYKSHRVFVEKLNMVRDRVKPTQKNPRGGVIEKEAPIHWSNVQMVCGKCARPVRVRRQIAADGVKRRVCAKCQGTLGA